MSDHDPAFLWETEAIRAAAQRATEAELDTQQDAEQPVIANGRWATLREASRSTGIPVETLRKWARRATIPTYLAPAANGTNIRMVDLDGVAARAADLGRPIAATAPTPEPAPEAVQPPVTNPTEVAPAPAPGTMIVPVDAWNKMLTQLGNLHEAGQHLAEARERAGKAETEVKFLRERLSELRQDPQTTKGADNSPPLAPEPVAPTAEPPEKVWRYLVRRVRDRKQG